MGSAVVTDQSLPAGGLHASDPPPSTSDIVHATNLSTCVLVVLVMFWSLAGHQLAQRSKYLTEGSAACALGLITGVILLIGHHFLKWDIVTQLLEFNAAGFFTYLLPPVIFYAGLSVEKSRFFLALPSILMYGVFGTLASFLIISVFMYLTLGFAMFKMEDCLAMGAIFAATDSVATLQVLDRNAMPNLFALVFGEGVVNDAVSVVLLGAVAKAVHGATPASGGSSGSSSGSSDDVSKHRLAGGIVFNFVWLLVTSLVLGSASGLAIAAALKKLKLQGAHQELSVIALLSYLSYLLADVAGLSAILSLFVCGVVVSHYALHNVSPEGRAATLTTFKTASYLAEGIIFIYVGMDALDPLKWRGANAMEAIWLVLVLTVLLTAARAAFVIPFSLLHNCWSAPADRLSRRDVVIVWWAGLMRGAVSVALVYYYFDDNPRQVLDRGRATLIVTTLMVVMISILGFGAFTKPLLAAMLKGDAEAAMLAAQLSRIPLLGHLTSSASNSSLFGDGGQGAAGSGGTFTSLTNSASRFHNNSSSPYSRATTPGDTTPPSHSRQDSGTTFQLAGGTSSGGNEGGRGSGRAGGRGIWGHDWGGKVQQVGGDRRLSGPHGSASSLGNDGAGIGIVMQQLRPEGQGTADTADSNREEEGGQQGAQQQGAQAGPMLPGVSNRQGFAGFDLDEGPVFVDIPDDDFANDGLQQQQHNQPPQQQQQSPLHVLPQAGQQRQRQQQTAVEMQQQQQQQPDPGSSGMVAAMRHVGEVWGAFDRSVMQPMFGGPGAAGSNAGAEQQQQQPPSGPPL